MDNTPTAYLVYENDKVNSFLAAILRTLNTDEKVSLRDALIQRTPKEQVTNEEDKGEHWTISFIPLLEKYKEGLITVKGIVGWLDSQVFKPLADLVPDDDEEDKLQKAIHILKLAEPYINDLEAENYEDKNAGIFKDEKLSNAYQEMKQYLQSLNQTP